MHHPSHTFEHWDGELERHEEPDVPYDEPRGHNTRNQSEVIATGEGNVRETSIQTVSVRSENVPAITYLCRFCLER